MQPDHILKSVEPTNKLLVDLAEDLEAISDTARKLFPDDYMTFEFITNDARQLVAEIEEIVGSEAIMQGDFEYAYRVTDDILGHVLYTWVYVNVKNEFSTAIKLRFADEETR